MKILISLLLLVLAPKKCNHTTVQENITITYQASSRGYFEEISVTPKELIICNDRNRKEYKAFQNTKANWKECLELLKTINTNKLPNLKAPTGMRLYDGAPHAMLIIKTGDEEIRSSSFDHGHPPAEIKTLVEKLLSFKKIASKQ